MIRLDFFLPFKAKPGPLRRLLRRIAPTLAAAPWRRLIQLGFFALFLYLFFHVSWPYTEDMDYAAAREAKEWIDAELFLALDPLVSVSTAIAARAWVWSLAFAAIMLGACILIPRGFCAYVCPLGTLIDAFDWAVTARIKRFRIRRRGWWVHLKYYLLLGTIVSALFGVLVAGFFASIPVLTRAFAFLLKPLQVSYLREGQALPELHAGHWVSIALFAVVLLLGFLGPRFWCRHVCPTGAIFSLGTLLRATERKVEATCIDCEKCVEICTFDAVKPDFTTRTADCTFCQTCGGVCPVRSIKFVDRWDRANPKEEAPVPEAAVSRRGFLAGTLAGSAMALGTTTLWGAAFRDAAKALPVRPPGSVPEPMFQELCIRCGACLQACPNDVLEASGFDDGLEGLWTPKINTDRAACEPECNNCGQVCPTGAIRALPLEEKRAARIGLAVVNEETCLPYAGRENCLLCEQACTEMGYDAIELMQVRTEVDDEGNPIEGTGYFAPVILPERCVGCGLCQKECRYAVVLMMDMLEEPAIRVHAGPGKEDRMTSGSYVGLREREAAERERLRKEQMKKHGATDDYLPDFLDD
ncbi:MAG: 4Fe-4S binding protein [Planctomycetota bacterium]|jgi:MauM/NapG family ferredoxin protein